MECPLEPRSNNHIFQQQMHILNAIVRRAVRYDEIYRMTI